MVWPGAFIRSADEETFKTISTRDYCDFKTSLDFYCNINFFNRPANHRLSSIVATISKKNSSVENITDLINAGMNIARVNACYGTRKENDVILTNIRKAIKKYNFDKTIHAPIAIALDLKGNEVRTGLLEMYKGANEIDLKTGEAIRLTTEKAYYDCGSHSTVYIDYPSVMDVPKSALIFLDGDLIKLRVETVSLTTLTCRILQGGRLRSSVRVTLPGRPVNLPPVSNKDQLDLFLGLKHEVDIIFASYVYNKEHIDEIRSAIGKKEALSIQVIAKISSQHSLKNLNEIIEASDGILIDRPKVCAETSTARLMLIQKHIFAKCIYMGKPSLCLGNLFNLSLSSGEDNLSEIYEAGQAVLDGCDGFVLGLTTANSDDPVHFVSMLSKICREAETLTWYKSDFSELLTMHPLPFRNAEAAACSAAQMAIQSSAAAIILVCSKVDVCQSLSRFRPRCPVVCVFRRKKAKYARRIQMFKGMIPIIFPGTEHEHRNVELELRILCGLRFCKDYDYLNIGDTIIVLVSHMMTQEYMTRIIYATSDELTRLDSLKDRILEIEKYSMT